MKPLQSRSNFFRNEEAVSEEFTVLPALSVVMIGFALFVVLVAQTYISYNDHINSLQRYQTADGILQKIINPDCFFIRSPGLVDIQLLQNDTDTLQSYFRRYTPVGYCFRLHIQWDNQTWSYSDVSNPSSVDYVAVSKVINVYCNEAQTIPGIITVLLGK